jgi:hypothetical protein
MEIRLGFIEWLIIILIVLGLLGVGPCADDCQHCGPQPCAVQRK